MYTDARGCEVSDGDIAVWVKSDNSFVVFEVSHTSMDSLTFPVDGSAYIQRNGHPRDNDGEILLSVAEVKDLLVMKTTGVRCHSLFVLRHKGRNVCAESEKELLAAYDKMAVV